MAEKANGVYKSMLEKSNETDSDVAYYLLENRNALGCLPDSGIRYVIFSISVGV